MLYPNSSLVTSESLILNCSPCTPTSNKIEQRHCHSLIKKVMPTCISHYLKKEQKCFQEYTTGWELLDTITTLHPWNTCVRFRDLETCPLVCWWQQQRACWYHGDILGMSPPCRTTARYSLGGMRGSMVSSRGVKSSIHTLQHSTGRTAVGGISIFWWLFST